MWDEMSSMGRNVDLLVVDLLRVATRKKLEALILESEELNQAILNSLKGFRVSSNSVPPRAQTPQPTPQCYSGRQEPGRNSLRAPSTAVAHATITSFVRTRLSHQNSENH